LRRVNRKKIKLYISLRHNHLRALRSIYPLDKIFFSKNLVAKFLARKGGRAKKERIPKVRSSQKQDFFSYSLIPEYQIAQG